MSRVFNRKAIQFLVLVAVLASPTLTAQSAESADWRASVSKFAAEHFRHPAWGFSHSVRDYELARDLAREDKITLDDDVLYAAAYLHDMAALAPGRNKASITPTRPRALWIPCSRTPVFP
jgi:uncharacterized protein